MIVPQELKPNNYGLRSIFANGVVEQLELDHSFDERIIFSNESKNVHFIL